MSQSILIDDAVILDKDNDEQLTTIVTVDTTDTVVNQVTIEDNPIPVEDDSIIEEYSTTPELDSFKEKFDTLTMDQKEALYKFVNDDPNMNPEIAGSVKSAFAKMMESIPEEHLIHDERDFPKELGITSLECLEPRVAEWPLLEGIKLKEFCRVLSGMSFDDLLIVLFYHTLKENFIHTEVVMEIANSMAMNNEKFYIPYDRLLYHVLKNVTTCRRAVLYALYYYWFGVSSFPMHDLIIDIRDLHEDTVELIRGTVFNRPYAESDPYKTSIDADFYITHDFINVAAYGINVDTDDITKINNYDQGKMTGALAAKKHLQSHIVKIIDKAAEACDASDD